MPKPHPIELRERVVAHVEEGHTHRGTAAHFKVSVKFVNDMVKLKQETGSLAPKYNPGKTGHGKLAPYKDWLRNRVDEQKDITIRKLCAELNEKFNLNVHHSPVWHVVRSFGLSHKKRLFMRRSNSAATCCSATKIMLNPRHFRAQSL